MKGEQEMDYMVNGILIEREEKKEQGEYLKAYFEALKDKEEKKGDKTNA